LVKYTSNGISKLYCPILKLKLVYETKLPNLALNLLNDNENRI